MPPKTIGLLSTKGGVGKSTITASLAVSLSKKYRVGIVDADMEKPSIPTIFNIKKERVEIVEDKFKPVVKDRIEIISHGFMVGLRSSLIWTKQMEEEAIVQLIELTDFTSNILLIDFPPGSQPSSQSILKDVHMDGTIIITTQNPLDRDGAERTLSLLQDFETPILGVIENMCRDRDHISSTGGREFGLPILGRIPHVPEVGKEMIISGTDGIAENVVEALRRPIVLKRDGLKRKVKREALRWVMKRT